MAWSIRNIRSHTVELALHEARAFFQQVVTTRLWNAAHGGVYVPVTEKTQPNPYLDAAHRDVTTLDGIDLTLVNPAFMTRQIGEIAEEKNAVWFHITSLNPIRPANKADEWEGVALRSFEQGEAQTSGFAEDEKGNPVFRYMAPLHTEKPCLKCHAKQGYQEGDIRGGISVTMLGDVFLVSERRQAAYAILTYGTILLLGVWGIVYSARRLGLEERRKEELILELKTALERVNVLSGLVPICASCKKIRDDKGFWNRMEEYIQTHSDARFSHGICPDCVHNLYPELVGNNPGRTEKHSSEDAPPTSSQGSHGGKP